MGESDPATGHRAHAHGARAPRHPLDPRGPVGRLVVAAALGAIATALAPANVDRAIRAVVGWDVAALVLIGWAWATIWRASPRETRRRAGADDPGRTVAFLLVVAASLFSFFAAAFVLRQVRAWPGAAGAAWSALAILAVASAWVLTHTVYTLRYAHLYYREGSTGGLEFPGEEPPADIDFAYFAFTLGMCFQVSDVAVSSSAIRRAVLFHALLSFIYNASILALALNAAFALFE